MKRTSIRVQTISPQHYDDTKRGTRRVRLRTPTPKCFFTKFNTQTVSALVRNAVIAKLRQRNGHDLSECLCSLHMCPCETTQSGASPLDATHKTTRTATYRLLNQSPRPRRAAIFTYVPTTNSVLDELFFDLSHIAPSATTSLRDYQPTPAALCNLRDETLHDFSNHD